MPNPGQQDLHDLPHRDARQLRHAGEHSGAAHRHQHRLRSVPRRRDGAHVLQQQRQSEGCARSRRRTFRRSPDSDCSTCHTSTLRDRRLRSDEHDPGDARRRSATHLQHLPRGGLELLHGRGESRAAGPAGRSHGRAAGRAERLQPVPHHGELEHDGAAGRPHAEPGQPGLQRLPHGGAHQLRDAGGQLGAAHRHHAAAAPSATAGTQLTFYNNNDHAEGRRARAAAYPVSCRAPTAAPAIPRALTRPAASGR